MGKAHKQAKRKALELQPTLIRALEETDNKRKDCVFVMLCIFLENGGKITVSPEWWEAATRLVATQGLPIPVIEQKGGLTVDFLHDAIKPCLPEVEGEQEFRNHLKRAQEELERAFKLCGKLGLANTEAHIVDAHQCLLSANVEYGREVPCMPYEHKMPLGFYIVEGDTSPAADTV